MLCFPFSSTANVPGKAVEAKPRTWAPAIHMGYQDRVPRRWLQPELEHGGHLQTKCTKALCHSAFQKYTMNFRKDCSQKYAFKYFAKWIDETEEKAIEKEDTESTYK